MATATSPYVPVDGDVVVEDGMTEDNIIIQSLHWIGFSQQNQRQNIINDSLGSFSDIFDKFDQKNHHELKLKEMRHEIKMGLINRLNINVC